MGDFNVNSEIMLCRFDEIPAISPVRIDAPYSGESHHKHCHKRVCRFGVMDIRRSCGCLQNITILVSYYIAFHAFDFLIAVYPFLGTGQRGTGAFTVDSPDCRLGEFASPDPYLLYKTVLNFRKRIHCTPTTEIVIHSLPLGIFCRQQPPLAAAYIYVYYSVKHEKEIIFAAPILIQNCSFYILLLSIGQIGQIHNSLSLFLFVQLFKQFSKHNRLNIRPMLIYYSHWLLNNLLVPLQCHYGYLRCHLQCQFTISHQPLRRPLRRTMMPFSTKADVIRLTVDGDFFIDLAISV